MNVYQGGIEVNWCEVYSYAHAKTLLMGSDDKTVDVFNLDSDKVLVSGFGHRVFGYPFDHSGDNQRVTKTHVKTLNSPPPTWVTLPLRTVVPFFLFCVTTVLSAHAFEADAAYAVQLRASAPRVAGIGAHGWRALSYILSIVLGWLWGRFLLPGWTWRGVFGWVLRCRRLSRYCSELQESLALSDVSPSFVFRCYPLRGR